MSESIQFPDPPPTLRHGRWWQLLAFFGPGAIIASVTITSGETIWASRQGAMFGYVVVWSLMAGAVMKAIQVYSGMRFMVLTGHHPMESWAWLPGPRGWCPTLIGLLSVVCFPFWIAGLAMMMGTLSSWIVGLDVTERANPLLHTRIWASGFIVFGVTATLLQNYGVLEKYQTAIVALLLFSLGLATIASKPDWLAALTGAVVPRVPPYPDWVLHDYPDIAQRKPWVEVMTFIGAVGGGTYDYLGYLGMLREKAWGMLARIGLGLPRGQVVPVPETPTELAKGRMWLRAPLIDCSCSFTSVVIFAAAFMLLGAVILRPQHLAPDSLVLLKHQAKFLTSIHPSLLYLYQTGVFMAFFGTILGIYEVYARTTMECLKGMSPRLGAIPLLKVRRAVVAYCGIVGLAIAWTFEKPLSIVTFPALLGGVLACGLWCFAIVWAERRFLPTVFRMRKGLLVATILAGTAMTTMGAVALWLQYLAPIFMPVAK